MSGVYVVRLEDVETEDAGRHERYAKRIGWISREMEPAKLGFHLEEVPPGSYSYPYHYHHCIEEMFVVLAGRGELRHPGGVREVRAGDLVFCGAGPEGAHQFRAVGEEPLRFLALSNMPEMDACEYPDSGKVLVGGLGKLFRTADGVGYLDGEEDPGRRWPDG